MGLPPVNEVLVQFNWPLGRGGRTTCPVHRGENTCSFSYKGELWSCFSCGASGNTYQLQVELGLIDKKPKEEFTVAGIDSVRLAHGRDLIPATRVSMLLSVAVAERIEALEERLIDDNRWGCELQRMGVELHGVSEQEEVACAALDTIATGADLEARAEGLLVDVLQMRELVARFRALFLHLPKTDVPGF